MLKVYKVYNYVSIDGGNWRKVTHSWFDDDRCEAHNSKPRTEFILSKNSFDEAYEYLSNYKVDGLLTDIIPWRKKQRIWIQYEDALESVKYKHFDVITYKREYVEWTDVSLEWIIKNLPAEQTIQYLKERGITTCSMNF
jgi:hypothetical protein